MEKKVISYCLYGNDPRYWQCLVANLTLAQEIYPGWEVWIHHCNVEDHIIAQLSSGGEHVTLIPVPYIEHKQRNMFHRFLPIYDGSVSRTIVRDADDLLNYTDRHCVDLWEESGKTFYTLHASGGHKRPVVGGLWGITRDWPKEKLPAETLYSLDDVKWAADERWLSERLLPLVKDNWLKLNLKHATQHFPGGTQISRQPTPEDSYLCSPGVIGLASYRAYLIGNDVDGKRYRGREGDVPQRKNTSSSNGTS